MNRMANGYLKKGITYVKFRRTNISQSFKKTVFISFHSSNTAFDMKLTATVQRQQKLIKDFYLYILQKNLANDFISQKYDLRRQGHCKVRLKLDPNDDLIEQMNQHTDPASQTNSEDAKRVIW